MRKLLIFCFILSVLPNLIKSQNWTKLGNQNWPTNPFNLNWDDQYNDRAIGNIGNGNIQSIWVDPSNPNHMMIGPFAGGIYESYNAIDGSTQAGGVVWNKITSNIPAQTVRKIIKKNNVIYASSGVHFWFGNRHYSNTHNQIRNLYGLGVIKSTDGGANWTVPVMEDQEKGFYCTDFTEPTSTGIMYAASVNNVYKSTDYGNTWAKVGANIINDFPKLEISLEQVVVNPQNPSEVWVAGSGIDTKKKIYKSTNGGNTWQEVETFFKSQVNATNCSGFSIDIDQATNTLYVAMRVNSTCYVFKSTDWLNFNLNNNLSTSNYNIRTNSNSLYLLGMPEMYKITSFSNISCLTSSNPAYYAVYSKTHVDQRSMAFTSYNNKNYLVVGNDGGVALSSDDGITWVNITGNMVAHIIDNMGYYSDPTKRAYDIGTQDDGWYRNIFFNSNPSTLPTGVSINQTYFTKTGEGLVYTSPHSGRIYFSNGLYSDNDGATKNNHSFHIDEMREDPLDYNINYRPDYENRVFFSNYSNGIGTNIFPSNFQTTYNVSIIPKIALNSNKNIMLPVLHYGNPSYPNDFPYKTNLFFSNDQGLSWDDIGQNIKNADPGKADVTNTVSQPLSWVDLDDYNPNKMWVTFGAAGLINQKVYESTDYGKTWKNISYNLSDVASLALPVNTPSNYPVNTIEYDENRDILFLGTDYGLFYLDKTVTPNQWKVFGTGLPRSIISNIFIDDYFNEVVVGTVGSGIWSAPLSVCNDELIMSNKTWNGITKTFCGDLRVKHDVTLNITNSAITARNVILEPGAKIIYNGGSLSSSDTTRKSFVICARDSKFSVSNGVVINNFTVNNFEAGTVETGNITMNNSSINVYKDSYYDFITGTKLSMTNSNLNFYSDYYYKTHNTTPVSVNATTFLSSISGINTNGFANNGKVNVYDNSIKIQNENLATTTSNTSNYFFQANDNITMGNNVDTSIPLGDFNITGTNTNVELVAKNYIDLSPGTNIKNSSTLVRIDSTLPSIVVRPYNKTESLPTGPYTGNNPFFNKEEEEEERRERNESNVSEKDQIKLYPVPVTTELNYNITDKDLIGKKAMLINGSGNIVKTITFNSEKGVIDFTSIGYGVYYLIVETKKGKISKKIVKQGLTDNNQDVIERKK